MENSKDSYKETHIPIIIGNYSPFRLVLRNEDIWQPTLEEINSISYNYVKLSRLSTFIDVGIAPFSLGIGFDGSLVLPAIPEFQSRDTAIAKFNETLGILVLGGIYCEAVQPTDISYGSLFFNGYVKQHGRSDGHNSSFHQAMKMRLIGTIDAIRLLNPNFVTVKELSIAYQIGKDHLSKAGKISPNLLLNGTSNYVKHQWTESLIFVWTAIEQLINIIWEGEIVSNVKNAKDSIDGRSKFLQDYRTWTTSTRIEMLYQKGIIKRRDYQLLNIARKSRNDFVHNGKPISEEKTRTALECLFRLISLKISDYENALLLDTTFEMILKNQRGELFPKKTTFSKDEISHWLAIPPLPGDNNWNLGDYEIIEELVLKPITK